MTQIDANLQTDIEKVLKTRITMEIEDHQCLLSPVNCIQYGTHADIVEYLKNIEKDEVKLRSDKWLKFKDNLEDKYQECLNFIEIYFECIAPIEKALQEKTIQYEELDFDIIWPVLRAKLERKPPENSYLKPIITALNKSIKGSESATRKLLSLIIKNKSQAIKEKLNLLDNVPKTQKRSYLSFDTNPLDNALLQHIIQNPHYTAKAFLHEAKQQGQQTFDTLFDLDTVSKNDDQRIEKARAQLLIGCLEIAELTPASELRKTKITYNYINEEGERALMLCDISGAHLERKIFEINKYIKNNCDHL